MYVRNHAVGGEGRRSRATDFFNISGRSDISQVGCVSAEPFRSMARHFWPRGPFWVLAEQDSQQNSVRWVCAEPARVTAGTGDTMCWRAEDGFHTAEASRVTAAFSQRVPPNCASVPGGTNAANVRRLCTNTLPNDQTSPRQAELSSLYELPTVHFYQETTNIAV